MFEYNTNPRKGKTRYPAVEFACLNVTAVATVAPSTDTENITNPRRLLVLDSTGGTDHVRAKVAP